MAGALDRELFSPELHLAELQQFRCGNAPYQQVSSAWIRATDPHDSVLKDIEQYQTRVWIYRDEDRRIIGFAALGTTFWSPAPKAKRLPVVIIPHIAVDAEFWGVPLGDPYADQILDDIRSTAAEYRETHPLLVLAVWPENHRAIRFYERNGFVHIEPAMKDGHLRMAINNAADAV